jgi:hypothetical protein
MVYRSMRGTCTGCKTFGTDGRLSFNNLKDLLFNSYIMYRMWKTNNPLHSVKDSHFSKSAANRKENTIRTPQLGYFSLYLLRASAAFPACS